jgi:hypothetical protein
VYPEKAAGRNLVALPGLVRAKLDLVNVTAKNKPCKEIAKNLARRIFPSTMEKLSAGFFPVVGINRHTEIQ